MNILIGSCGGLTGQYLIKQFKKFSESPKLIGFDSNYYCYSRLLCDKFVSLPLFSEESSYIEALIDLLQRNEIDLYIPTYSQECKLLAKYESIIRSQTASFFCVSPYKTFKQLDDKLLCYLALEYIGIDCPKILDIKNNLVKYPVFLKPRVGSGGKGAHKVNFVKEMNEFINLSEYLITEFIEGIEYTVDCLFDNSGILLSCNARTREKVLGGATVVSRNVGNNLFEEIVRKISEVYIFKGCINLQFIQTSDRLVCIDINMRFPSGGLPLSVESGINFPRVLYEWALDRVPNLQLYKNDQKPRIMYRYFEEEFELL